MKERRKFSRWQAKEKALLGKEGSKEEALLLDVSIGGMRVLLNSKINAGSSLSGQFKIIPDVGTFYVRGEVVWVRPVTDKTGKPGYEVGVKFDKVSTLPI